MPTNDINWVIAKEIREVEIIMDGATERYKTFLNDYPKLQVRVQQYHFGITATQLSRISKKYLEKQPM